MFLLFNLRSSHPKADLRPRPSMHTHNRDMEKSSGQAAQFNVFEQYEPWTGLSSTSGEPEFVAL